MRCMAALIVSILICSTQASADSTSVRDTMRQEAAALASWVKSDVAKAFLGAVPDLPAVTTRRVYYNKTTRDALVPAAAETLSAEARASYEARELDEAFYYTTRYGTPLAFVRPLDLLGQAGLAKIDGIRIADFGFGSIGQLRLLASLGATAIGIDVDKMLRALYREPADVGAIPRAASAGKGAPGRVELLFGQYPAEADLVTRLGTGLDAFVSKNTLKRGYIHPAKEVDPRMLVHLGVDDATFVRAVYAALKPGGYFLIYNLYPAQPADRYIPWADGQTPFTRELLEEVGFTVLAYDVDDTAPARAMGATLGWAEQMNLETDLFGIYTLVRKPK
jgi:hypothetical protein